MRGSRVLLEHAAAAIYPGQKVGVIGRNGCGKSSLFAAIKGELAPEKGTLTVPKDLTISEVSQQTPSLDAPALEYVISGDKELAALLREKEQAYAKGDGNEIALAEDRLTTAGIWTIRPRSEILLHGLGFADDEMEKPVKSFSGGWRMRLNLAQALICRSRLLLLDEPTNHLDLDTILFLEGYLKNFEGTIMCISHDRDFLDTFCSHILHFESGKLVMYTGNYSDYERLRAERIKNELASRRREEATLAHMQAFVDRFRYKATKARQAQSLLKAMERLKLTAVTQEESPYHISFAEPERTVEVIATIRDLDAGYSQDQVILRHLNLLLLSGDRIGLLGRNGQGKSTFIKTLCGVLKPLSGTAVLGKGIRIGYFAQHELDSLREGLSALDHLRLLDKEAKEKDLRSFLGSFNFSGKQAEVPVRDLSGGEQARLALCLIAYQKPNLLLLDEPTNHLDLDMREALSLALASYSGALILVSHDRHLLEAIAEKLWLVNDGTLTEFDGDLNDYQEYLTRKHREYAEKLRSGQHEEIMPASSRGQNAAPEERPALSFKQQRKLKAQFRESLKPLKNEIEALEMQMAEHKKQLANIDATLSDSSLYAGGREKIEELLKKRAAISSENEACEDEWLKKQEALEKRMQEYEELDQA